MPQIHHYTRRLRIPQHNHRVARLSICPGLSSAPQATTSTPWIDFIQREQEIKKAQAAQQEFLNRQTEFPREVLQSSLRENYNQINQLSGNVTLNATSNPSLPQFLEYPYARRNENCIPAPTIRARDNRSVITQTRESASALSFPQALRLIPYFDGDPDNLNLFCVSVRHVLATFGYENEQYILLALAEKLTGRAAVGYRTRLTSYTSIEQLLMDVATQYSNVGIADEIIAKIKVISQQQGEAAGDFGLRVQKLHNCLLTIYDSAPDLEPADRRLFKSAADRDALQQFLFGLSHPLDYQVRSERPSSLSEAIRLAIDFECRQSARRSTALVNHTVPLPAQPFLPQSSQYLQQIQPLQQMQPLQQIQQTTPMQQIQQTTPMQQIQQPTSMQQIPQTSPIEQLLQVISPQMLHNVPQQIQPLAVQPAMLTASNPPAPQNTAQILRALVGVLQTKLCTFCGRNGHTENTCRRKLTCEYCGRPGHALGDCYTIQDDLRSGRLQQNRRNDTPMQNNNNNRNGRYNNNNRNQRGKYRNNNNNNNSNNAQSNGDNRQSEQPRDTPSDNQAPQTQNNAQAASPINYNSQNLNA